MTGLTYAFSTPQVTIAFVGELAAGLDRLRTAVHERRPNPYHGIGPDEQVNRDDDR
jgi:hypothetical protein